MKSLLCLVLTLSLLAGAALHAQTAPAAPAPTKPEAAKPADIAKPETAAPAPTTPPPGPAPAAPTKDEIAVTINGKSIPESKVESAFKSMLERQIPGLDEEKYQQYKQMLYGSYRDRIIQGMIAEELFNAEAAKAGITVDEKEKDKMIEEDLQRFLKVSGKTREEFAKSFQEESGRSLNSLIAEMKKNPNVFIQNKYFNTKYAAELKFTDEQMKEYYEKNKETKFHTPEMVRASHILIPTMDPTTRSPLSKDEQEAAKKKAQEVLAEVKKPNADFAALAKQYSKCPSAAKSGDLGEFPRKQMDPNFDKAAFELKVGEISGLVTSSFGYHIIKVTDHKAEETKSFEQVKEVVQNDLKTQKINEIKGKLFQDLQKNAKIEYPPGKEPKPAPMMPQRPTPQAAPEKAPANSDSAQPAGGNALPASPARGNSSDNAGSGPAKPAVEEKPAAK